MAILRRRSSRISETISRSSRCGGEHGVSNTYAATRQWLLRHDVQLRNKYRILAELCRAPINDLRRGHLDSKQTLRRHKARMNREERIDIRRTRHIEFERARRSAVFVADTRHPPLERPVLLVLRRRIAI